MSQGEDVEAISNVSGLNSLMIASQNGYLQIVMFLVENGANVNGTAILSCLTPLMFASKEGHYDIVKFLLGRIQVKF